jgi:TetR/AcrR family transcriptional regulator, lmrAB and yxaGH operons repressor
MNRTRNGSERTAIVAALGEVFREHGFEGASLSLISERTGLGKGSLYHFFPGGKDEMAAAVLDDIAQWFEVNLFTPLEASPDPHAGIRCMFQTVDEYFLSGRRTCLIGAFALDDVRDRFSIAIHDYFTAWRNALADALHRAGKDRAEASELAEAVIVGIQGALVGARAFQESALFQRTLKRLQDMLRLT